MSSDGSELADRVHPRVGPTQIFILFCLELVLFGLVFLTGFLDNFPAGLYRQTAMIFVCGMGFVWVRLLRRRGTALATFLFLMPFGARLAEYFSPELSSIIVTVDLLAVGTTALIYYSIYKLKSDKVYVFFLIFIVHATLSMMANVDPLAITIICSGVLSPFVAYAMVVSAVKDREDLTVLVNALGGVIIVCSLFSFVQPALNGRLADYFYLRFSSVFYNPIIFANVIILLWPFLLVFKPSRLVAYPNLLKGIIGAFIVMVLAAETLTGSRGGMVICGTQLLWLIYVFTKKSLINSKRFRRLFVLCLILVSGISIGSWGALYETVFRRFGSISFSEKGNSVHERMLGARGGLELGFQNPVFGVGLGSFPKNYLKTKAGLDGSLMLESAHNFILNLFAEMGFSGLLLWITILSFPVRRIFQAKPCQLVGTGDPIGKVMQCSILGYTATQFLFYGEFLHKNVGLPMVLYFVALGLGTSYYNLNQPVPELEPVPTPEGPRAGERPTLT